MSEKVLYRVENHLCLIKMNDPAHRNALGEEMLIALAEAFTRFEQDAQAWAAVLTGEGRVFCSGADLGFFKRALEGEEFNNMFLSKVNLNPLMRGEVTKPVIMAVNGPAIGGGTDLALRGDFIIAADSAFFLLPESELGNVLLFWEGLPIAVAKELVCGFRFPAQRAYEQGLINQVVPADSVEDSAVSFAYELLSRPPLTIRKNIQIMNDLWKMSQPMPRKVLMDYCARLSNDLASSEDSKAAMAAFLNKTKPTFQAK